MQLELFSNTHALMDLSFVQIGLALVSAFFVLAGYMVVYENPLQSKTELQVVVDSIKSVLSNVDSFWFEQAITWRFESVTIPLSMLVSKDYIQLTSLTNKDQSVLVPVTQKLWIVTSNVSWNNASTCHQLIYNHTGYYGYRDDPCLNESELMMWIDLHWNQDQQQFHQNPWMCSNIDTVVFEKCIIYTQKEIDGKQSIVPSVEFVILRKV
ncbi:MAG: hypothetical protein KGY50_05130 [Candidatus Thermoplasmatota archaeon]|nr:hypothetical protein [Candidatus Thermoplasmatota archaeon]